MTLEPKGYVGPDPIDPDPINPNPTDPFPPFSPDALDPFAIFGNVSTWPYLVNLINMKVTLWQGDVKVGETRTNWESIYSFSSLEPGTYTVKTGGEVNNGVYYEEDSQTITISNQNKEYDFIVHAAEDPNAPISYEIEGSVYVMLSSLSPIPGIPVELWHEGNLLATTQTYVGNSSYNSYYKFTKIQPGSYTVRIPAGTYGGMYCLENKQSVLITDRDGGKSFTLLKGEAPLGYTVSGQIQMPNGNALAETTVQLLSGDVKMAETTTDSNGNFTFSGVSDGVYMIKVSGGTYAGILCQNLLESFTVNTQAVSIGSLMMSAAAVPEEVKRFDVEINNNKAVLTWDKPDRDGGLEIIRYEVSKDHGSSWITASANSSHTFTDLAYGQTYTFMVRAVNLAGNGNAVSMAATPHKPASAPRNLFSVPGSKMITLKWQYPADIGSGELQKYQVSKDDGVSWVDVSAETYSYTFTGLNNGETYICKVRAVTSAGAGAEVLTAETPMKVVPNKPQYLKAVPGEEQITLSWETPIDNGETILGYDYSVSTDGSIVWQPIPNSDASTKSYTINGLTNGQGYTLMVRARNSVGAGHNETVTGTPVTIPSAVQNVNAEAGDGKVTLTWGAPANKDVSKPSYYQVAYAESPYDSEEWQTAGYYSCTIEGLTNGTAYVFKLRAGNGAGYVSEPVSVTVTPQALTPPGSPQEFKAAAGNEQVVLTWQAQQNDTGILRYEVSKDNGVTWITAASNTSHTFTGLSNDQTYTFKVRAVNAAGNGEAASAEAVPQADTYIVTIKIGTDKVILQSHAANEQVTIKAEAELNGQQFDQWTSADSILFADVASAETSFTMPAKNVTVTAEYKANENRKDLLLVKPLQAIENVANGTSLEMIMMPVKAEITTTDGSYEAAIIWDWESAHEYDSSRKTAQTFTIQGRIALPEDVSNPDQISLEVSISVTVAAENEDVITNIAIKDSADKLVYTEGEELDLSGLTLELEYSESGKKTITPAEFDEHGIVIMPAEGTALTVNDERISVSTGNLSTSFTITVNAMQTVDKPVISPGSGTYVDELSVTITCNTEDAGIYYTKDGSRPTKNSLLYTGPFTVKSSGMIQAIAIKDGMNESEIAAASYIISNESTPVRENEPVHSHIYGGTWHSDAHSHWQQCAADGAEGNKGNHSAGEWIIKQGKKVKECMICGHTMKTEEIESIILAEGKQEIKANEEGYWVFHGNFRELKTLSLNGVKIGIKQESENTVLLTYPGYEGPIGKAEAGSVKITFYAQFLKTLPEGAYTLVSEFDGETESIGSMEFTKIEEVKTETANEGTDKTVSDSEETSANEEASVIIEDSDVPKTGLDNQFYHWMMIMNLSFIGSIFLFVYRNKKEQA